MKYVIIIPDGAADYRLDELNGRTPFEVADIPHIDRLAVSGRQGTVTTTPQGMTCGSDVCTMCLLGYDPTRFHTGRAPLEAAALGIDMTETDWAFRANFVTITDGRMRDHSAGHIADEEAHRLRADFTASVGLPEMSLLPGVSYRNILIDQSGQAGNGRDYSELLTTGPHDIPGEPIRKHLPVGGEYAALIQGIIDDSGRLFEHHEINLMRREMGEPPVTHLWPWGQGKRPAMPRFDTRFGLQGAMITAVDLLAGIGNLIGWDRLDVPGQTSYHDNDYVATGQHGVAALADYDIICLHIEAPDEASHAADAATKVAAIEAIDRHVVGPVHDALESNNADWRLLLLPDHYTSVATRKHDLTPVPFLICGKQVRGVRQCPFTEENANAADLHITHGHELMEYFLYSGLGSV